MMTENVVKMVTRKEKSQKNVKVTVIGVINVKKFGVERNMRISIKKVLIKSSRPKCPKLKVP